MIANMMERALHDPTVAAVRNQFLAAFRLVFASLIDNAICRRRTPQRHRCRPEPGRALIGQFPLRSLHGRRRLRRRRRAGDPRRLRLASTPPAESAHTSPPATRVVCVAERLGRTNRMSRKPGVVTQTGRVHARVGVRAGSAATDDDAADGVAGAERADHAEIAGDEIATMQVEGDDRAGGTRVGVLVEDHRRLVVGRQTTEHALRDRVGSS